MINITQLFGYLISLAVTAEVLEMDMASALFVAFPSEDLITLVSGVLTWNFANVVMATWPQLGALKTAAGTESPFILRYTTVLRRLLGRNPTVIEVEVFVGLVGFARTPDINKKKYAQYFAGPRKAVLDALLIELLKIDIDENANALLQMSHYIDNTNQGLGKTLRTVSIGSWVYNFFKTEIATKWAKTLADEDIVPADDITRIPLTTVQDILTASAAFSTAALDAERLRRETQEKVSNLLKDFSAIKLPRLSSVKIPDVPTNLPFYAR